MQRCNVLTGNEIKQRIKRYEARFNAADENNDGKLSVGEFVAFQHLDLFPRMHDVFVEEIVETMDKNEDGKISYEEFIGGIIITRNNIITSDCALVIGLWIVFGNGLA